MTQSDNYNNLSFWNKYVQRSKKSTDLSSTDFIWTGNIILQVYLIA